MFNMGVGMVIICSKEKVDGITVQVPEAKIVGEIVPVGEHIEQVIID